ncbi:MAG: O-antigen ligase family protein [Desulfotomaculaceae bacterium]
MNTQNLQEKQGSKFIFPAAALAGLVSGTAAGKWPFALAGGILTAAAFFLAPEMLGFFTGGGLYLVARTLDLGTEGLFLLNIGSFLLPLYIMCVLVLLRKKAGSLVSLLGCWELWAVLGLGLLLVVRLPGSLDVGYGMHKAKYYLANNMVCFLGPVLATAAWGIRGLHRLLKGVFLGGLGLTVYFWLSASYTELPFNIYAVLNFNPIGLSRMVGMFMLLAVCARFLPLAVPVRLALILAGGSAMALFDARGPVVALVLAMLWAGLVRPGRKSGWLPLLALVIFMVMLVLISTLHWMPIDLFSLDDTGRLSFYQVALHAFIQNPAVGAGTGSFAALAPASGVAYPHNLFLELAAELGIIGLVLSLGLVFVPLGRLAFSRQQAGDAPLAGALMMYCLANAMVSGDVNGNFLLWLAAGVTASLTMAGKDDGR